MALASPGLQTGFTIFPLSWNMGPTNARTKTFRGNGLENPGIVFSLLSPAQGSINASSGEYTGPTSVSSPVIDTVVATAVDGSVATAQVFLS